MSSTQEKTGWRSYLYFLLPFLGLLIVLFYLSVFSLYRRWDVVQPEQNPTNIRKFFIEPLASLRYTLDVNTLGANPGATLNNTITAKNAVIWGYATGLVAIALLLAILISGYVIWNGPRREINSETRKGTNGKRWLITFCLLLFSLVLYPLVSHWLGFFANYTQVARQLWEVISSQFTDQGSWINFFSIEILVVALGYGVSMILVWASASTLWSVREIALPDSAWTPKQVEDAANHVSRQMKNLRLVLYAGAVVMVLIMFRHKWTSHWALEYVKPLQLLKKDVFEVATILYTNFESMIANNLLATSVFNTLLLAGIYVPSALVLQRRADRLAQLAVKLETQQPDETQKKDEKTVALTGAVLKTRQQEWIKSYGLTHPLKEQLPKAIAILSPLLAGPIGELLNFFK